MKIINRKNLDLKLLILFSMVGIAISVYLTFVHYAHVPLICSATGLIDCAKVVTSPYSVIPFTDIPITVLGVFYFIVNLGLAGVQFSEKSDSGLQNIHLMWNLLGLLTVFYLIFVELIELHHICEWCSGVHLMIIASLIIVIMRYNN